jgi:predicted DNA-binding protein YlxM (UPF0122 family)
MTGKPTSRRSASKAREWTVRRNQDIKTDHQAGWSLGEIAEATGLSKSAVAKIVNRN